MAGPDYLDDLGNPGDYPFTRSVHATLYRGRPQTTRMFAGFGSAEETNARYRYVLGQGSMGLSVAFDLPKLIDGHAQDPQRQEISIWQRPSLRHWLKLNTIIRNDCDYGILRL